jgi:hypothetical protein
MESVKKSVMVCSVEVMVGSIIRPTYSKAVGELKTYGDCQVEAIQLGQMGSDFVLRVKLLEGGYRSFFASQIKSLN